MENSIITLLKNKILNNKKMTEKQINILEASVDLFSQKGFANTSTSEIAKRAKVAEGTIFKHFKNKDNLLIATILPLLSDDIFSQIATEFQEKALKSEHVDFDSFIESLVRNRLDFINENNKMIKIFIDSILYKKETREKFISLVPKNVIKSLNNILDTFKKKKLIVNWPNSVIIRFMVTNLISYGLYKYTLFPDNNWDDEEQIHYITKFLVKGLSYNS